MSANWVQTYTGKKFWIHKDPGVVEIGEMSANVDIVDIAHALSNICRFGGHSDRFYSVAEHSVWLSRKSSRLFRKRALLDDASEAYIQDFVRPVKKMFPEYETMEAGLSQAIFLKFRLPALRPDSLTEADNRMLSTEAKQVFRHPTDNWADRVEPYDDVTIEFWSPDRAKAMFLETFLS